MCKIKMLNMNIYCLTSFPPFSLFPCSYDLRSTVMHSISYIISFLKRISLFVIPIISPDYPMRTRLLFPFKKKSKSNKGVLNCSSAVLHIKPNFKKNYKVFFLSFIKSTMSTVLSDDEIPLAQRVKGKAMCFLIRGMLDCNTL